MCRLVMLSMAWYVSCPPAARSAPMCRLVMLSMAWYVSCPPAARSAPMLPVGYVVDGVVCIVSAGRQVGPDVAGWLCCRWRGMYRVRRPPGRPRCAGWLCCRWRGMYRVRRPPGRPRIMSPIACMAQWGRVMLPSGGMA